MNKAERKARDVLGGIARENGELSCEMDYIFWEKGAATITLDGDGFTADQLEAIAWWMRNKK